MSTKVEWLHAAFNEYLAKSLARFRASLEEGTGQPIHELSINPALLLSDLCCFLALDVQQHDLVLGESGVWYVAEVWDTRVSTVPVLPDLLEQVLPMPEAVLAPSSEEGAQ